MTPISDSYNLKKFIWPKPRRCTEERVESKENCNSNPFLLQLFDGNNIIQINNRLACHSHYTRWSYPKKHASVIYF